MSIGELRERLRFEVRPKRLDDSYGNVEGPWQIEFVAYARVLPLKGSEPVIAARLAGVQPAVITVRSSKASREVTPSWRAVDVRTGTIWNIRSSANFDERNRYLTFMAESGVPT